MFCLKEEQEKQCVELLKTRATHHFALAYWYILYRVKANVLFYNKPASKEAWTKDVWIYDYRTMCITPVRIQCEWRICKTS
jgi:hypothetical protein